MFFSYKNCKLLIDNREIEAQKVDISWDGAPEPAYSINKKYNDGYTPTKGIQGGISFSYLLTGVDPLANNIINEDDPILLQFGGLVLPSGYLKRYSFSTTPNTPTTINVDLVFFGNITGNFSPVSVSTTDVDYLNVSDIQIYSNQGGNSIGSIDNLTKFNYQYDIQINPQYEIGQSIPTRIAFGHKNVGVDFSSDKINGFISISGNKVSLTARLVHPVDSGIFQNFDCRGILYQKNLDTYSNSLLNSSYYIRQNDLSSFNISNEQSLRKPIIYSISPNTGFYGTNVIISGKNLSTVTNISFTDNIYDPYFHLVNDTQITTIVPNDAISGPITLYSNLGDLMSNNSFYIGGLPITVSNINPIYQNINNKVIISGDNFYEINRVLFGGNKSAQFTKINKNLIEAVVPANSSFGKISVISDIFLLSGQSANEFVPIPSIDGFSPANGLTGDTILITGQAFSGITGVKFNNLPASAFASFTVLDNNNLTVTVPSGNTRGYIKLYAQSGITSLSTLEFAPNVEIIAISPLSGHTGDIITISGRNFIPEILFNIGGNNSYAVSFEQGVTGYFANINNILLSGAVPSGARSGIIAIYSSLQDKYASTGIFNVRKDAPRLYSISPNSGKSQDVISVVGENFYDINSLILTGINTGVRISNNFSISNTNDFINFIVPTTVTGGVYSVLVNAHEGVASGYNLLTILDKPFISGYYPLSGGIDKEIFVSGRNLYNLTKVYIDNTGTIARLNSGSFSGNSHFSFYIPANLSSGAHNIIINNSVSGITGISTFNFIPNPTISGFYPTSGQWGDVIKISGLYYNNVTGVYLGNNLVNNFNIIGNTGISLTLPNLSSDYLKLINIGGSTISTNKLIISPPLAVISGFIPNPTYFGSGIVISGAYLDTVKEIHFSGQNNDEITITNFNKTGQTGINFIIPGGITGGYLKFVNDRGFSYSPQQLQLIPDAVISYNSLFTGVFKDFGYISGSQLSGSSLYFKSYSQQLIEADNISIVGDTGIKFYVPRDIVTSTIVVRGRNNKLISDSGNITILPTISGLYNTVTSNTYATGSYIFITGINSYNSFGVGISGNNGNVYNISQSFTVNSSPLSTSIDQKTGYCLLSGIISDTFAGTGKLFLYPLSNIENSGSVIQNILPRIAFNTPVTISQPPPVITNFYPTGGFNTTLITITGRHLFSTNNVFFNVGSQYIAGTIASFSNSRLTVYPPFMATGTGSIIVTTSFGTTSTGIFRVLSPLSISGYTPTSAHTGAYIRISGSGLLNTTGVTFGGYNANFTKTAFNNTYIISGIVPSNFNCCGDTVNICVINEGGSYCA